MTHIGRDTGKLPLEVPEPNILCDPSYCIKGMVKDIFGLTLMSKKKSEYEKIDAQQLKRIWDVGLVKVKFYNLMSSKNQQTH